MANNRNRPPQPTATDSIDDAARLVGQLQPDGTVALETEDPFVDIPTSAIEKLKGDLSDSRKAMIAAVSAGSTDSSISTPSEEDYDSLKYEAATIIPGAKGAGVQQDNDISVIRRRVSSLDHLDLQNRVFEDLNTSPASPSKRPRAQLERRISIPVKLEKTDRKGQYRLTAEDYELRDILRQRLEHDSDSKGGKRRSKFSDLVFTRQFTAFDRQNPISAASPFHGFFTLFWLGTALMIIRVASQNWKQFGSIFGRNEIMGLMFRRDVIVLGLTDGVMCGATAMGLLLQKVILRGWLSWNREGWILQHIWQTSYLIIVIWWTIHREWPWTHTVFILLHCLVMLMKQHSYNFYNGYLSEVQKRRTVLQRKLKQLDQMEPATTPSSSPTARSATSPYQSPVPNSAYRRRLSIANTEAALRKEDTQVASVASAIGSGDSLDLDQIQAFERIINWEIDELSEELKGKSTIADAAYPKNLTIKNWAEYIVFPTLVYELEYPRQESINWFYVAEKTLATFGSLGVMIVVSQAFIYPVVMQTVRMRDEGLTLTERLHEFPWVLSDLLFPFMMEYLLSWYVIWECILNVLAELTKFADRGFYGDWWNTVSWDQYAKDWNRPVHAFLLRHVYHSSISALRVSRGTATLITFFLSACIHELVMWCIFKKLRGYLLIMQMSQLPLVMLSRTRLLKGRALLGNVIFWLGIFTGPSFLCSLYLII